LMLRLQLSMRALTVKIARRSLKSKPSRCGPPRAKLPLILLEFLPTKGIYVS
jgi:hypothetical protein